MHVIVHHQDPKWFICSKLVYSKTNLTNILYVKVHHLISWLKISIKYIDWFANIFVWKAICVVNFSHQAPPLALKKSLHSCIPSLRQQQQQFGVGFYTDSMATVPYKFAKWIDLFVRKFWLAVRISCPFSSHVVDLVSLSNLEKMSAESVKVIVRCRPMNEKETSENYEGYCYWLILWLKFSFLKIFFS